MRTWIAATLALALAACSADSPPRPNIVLITLDTTRVDHISCYGYERATTPYLDQLAEDGQRYTASYSVSSWTLPSHASLFTGKLPSSHGARYDPKGELNLVQEGGIKGPEAWSQYRARPLARNEITLAQVLGEYGYATGAVVAGPWLKRVFGLAKGFASYDDENFEDRGDFGELNGRPGGDVTRAAIEFVEEHAEEPFFLFLNYFDAHGPRVVDEEYRKRFWPGPVPSTPDPEFVLALYDAEIAYADDCMGRFIERLKELGLYEDTWIIVTADHGELMGDNGLWGHGDCLSEAEILTPLIIKEPGAERPRGIVDTPVQHLDIMPTLLDRLRIPLPPNLQGGVLPGARHPVVAEVYPLPKGPSHDRDWRQIGDWRVLYDGQYKFAWNSAGKHALYDLANDPTESTNIISREPQRARQMRRNLLRYIENLPAPGELGDVEEIDAETLRLLQGLGYLGDD